MVPLQKKFPEGDSKKEKLLAAKSNWSNSSGFGADKVELILRFKKSPLINFLLPLVLVSDILQFLGTNEEFPINPKVLLELSIDR